MSKNNTFTVDGKTYKVLSVSPEIQLESQRYYAKAFDQAIDDGAPLHIQIKSMLQQRKLLDDKSDEQKLSVLRKEIKDLELTLRKGVLNGQRMTKPQGRAIALQIRSKRSEINSIGGDISSLFSSTAENQADNERYQYYIYACTVNEYDGSPVWKTFEDFKASDTKSELVQKALSTFLLVSAGIDKNFEKNRYENQWLIKMKFMNEAMQLTREDGKAVDEEGRLINAEGRFIDESGGFVDAFGNAVDKEGNLLEKDTWGVCPISSSETSEPLGTGAIGANTTSQV